MLVLFDFFIFFSFLLGWPCVVDWTSEEKEIEAFLLPSYSSFLFVSFFCCFVFAVVVIVCVCVCVFGLSRSSSSFSFFFLLSISLPSHLVHKRGRCCR